MKEVTIEKHNKNIGYRNAANWQMGISNSLYQYHMCVIHETAIVEGNGINDAVIINLVRSKI